MVTSFQAPISGWQEFADIIQEIRGLLPKTQQRFLRTLGAEYLGHLRAIISPMSVSGTYLESLTSSITDIDGQPALMLELVPQGPEAERLPIYWRVLERGAQANPRMPESTLIAWSLQKFGSPQIGLAIVNANRKMMRGIQSNPVLSSLFLFGEDLVPIGLTPFGEQVARDAGEQFLRDMDAAFQRRGGLA